jgi:hypothetical protein
MARKIIVMTPGRRLTENQVKCAIYFWSLGKDTFDIAQQLGVSEAAVANSLAAWREEQREKAAG